jgi:predicted ATP-dependent serine protease
MNMDDDIICTECGAVVCAFCGVCHNCEDNGKAEKAER